MPTVWNKRQRSIPKDAVYVGRPTDWGNPFTHLPLNNTVAAIQVASRAESVEWYSRLAQGDFASLSQRFTPALSSGQLTGLTGQFIFIQAHLHELKGKDLVCWCAPQACHADILLKLANE